MSEVLSWLEWTLVPAILGFLLVYVWHLIKDPYISISVIETSATSSDYYSKAFGGFPEGDKVLTVRVIVKPSKPIAVENVNVRIGNKTYDALDFSPTKMDK